MQIIEEINRGGFGRVERVRLPDGTIVARKVFCPSQIFGQADTPKLKQRFQREVNIQKALTNDYFIRVLDSDLQAPEPWFTMPLASQSLADEILAHKQAGTIPQQALADVLNGLEELHRLGFVHRDLKPHNILLHDECWKLSDFGLALPPPSSTTTRLTATDSIYFTQLYCAPEQSRNFHTVTPAADVYAFGCILHDIFSTEERIPFHRQTAAGPVGPIIERCTETDPDRRFKTIKGLRGALLTVLAKSSALSPTIEVAEWVDKIGNIPSWSTDEAAAFERLATQVKSQEDRWAIFSAMDEDSLSDINQYHPSIWTSVALAFCDWARGQFQWEYCDVLANLLQFIATTGPIPVTSSAILSAARLGESHNRWFVMRRLLEMAGPSLDSNIADRVSIEIRADEVQNDFVRCAHEIHRQVDEYHPSIAAALLEY